MDPVVAQSESVEKNPRDGMVPKRFVIGKISSIEAMQYLSECSGCEECEEDGTCMNDVLCEAQAVEETVDVATVLGEVFGIPAGEVSAEAIAVGRELELDVADWGGYHVQDWGNGTIEVFFRYPEEVRKALERFVPESVLAEAPELEETPH